MSLSLPKAFRLSQRVSMALRTGKPVVALETTVLTHGLPSPTNLELASDMETTIRENMAEPATIGIVDGKVQIGMDDDMLEELVNTPHLLKISRRDYGIALARKESGGTTVAGTLIAAHTAGIEVFATGGIGGVHRGGDFDISTDLHELSQRPVVVVCAGAKSILDLPATLEYLETMGVMVVGYQTDEFPAFYSQTSGLPVQVRVDSPEEVAQIARSQWDIGLRSALLLVVPPPEDVALPNEQVESAVEEALEKAAEMGIRGQQVTPFLLEQVSLITGKASLKANLGLLLNNAKVAAHVARAIQPFRQVAI